MYAVSTVLFGVAYYKKRPVTKFTKPSQIPDHFIKQKLRQQGKVAGIETHMEHGPLLQINHSPPLSLFSGSRKTLPVKLAGVSINSNGLSWLQSVCVDKRIEFLPLTNKHIDHVECLVFLHDQSADKKELDVAEALLSLGFARTNNLPLKIAHDKQLEHYYKLLNSVEKQAKKNREGEWNWRLPTPILPIRVWQQLWKQAAYHILPTSRRLPALVRP